MPKVRQSVRFGKGDVIVQVWSNDFGRWYCVEVVHNPNVSYTTTSDIEELRNLHRVIGLLLELEGEPPCCPETPTSTSS